MCMIEPPRGRPPSPAGSDRAGATRAESEPGAFSAPRNLELLEREVAVERSGPPGAPQERTLKTSETRKVGDRGSTLSMPARAGRRRDLTQRSGGAVRGGAWRVERLPGPLPVHLDLLDGQQAIGVGVGGLEILEERVGVFLQRDAGVVLPLDRLQRFGASFGELGDREEAVLVLVAQEEGLHHRLVELPAIELAVAVSVLLAHPRPYVRRGGRLGRRRDVDQDQAERGGGQAEAAGTHRVAPQP